MTDGDVAGAGATSGVRSGIHGADWVMIVVYLILVLAIGLYETLKEKLTEREQSRRGSEEGQAQEVEARAQAGREIGGPPQRHAGAVEYFLAGRSTPWWAVGMSLFASNIGSEHFVGLAGSGAKIGMCVSWGEWLSPLCILLLGWVFVPFYLRTGVYTMPEFLERRYDKTLRVYYSILLLFMYIVTKVSVALYAGAVVLQQTIGWDLFAGAASLVVATGAYTVVGGMHAVIYTEVLQTVILIAGGLALLYYSLALAGGLDSVWSSVPEENRHLFQPASHHDFPWTGVLLGMPFTSVWYWCTDQNVVQRTLSAKSLGDARAGAIMAGYLKILVPFMMVLPGIVCRAMYGRELAASPEGYNIAFPLLVMRVLPTPILGIMVAAMLAALMSSLASVFNSTSTVFTMDVWRSVEPNASQAKLVLVGKAATAAMTVLGILWIPLITSLQVTCTHSSCSGIHVDPPDKFSPCASQTHKLHDCHE